MKILHSPKFPALMVMAVSALCGLKLWLSTGIGLFGDEAFYFLESRQLALAYSDLPPLTAWLIRLGTSVGEHSLVGIRWPFIVLASLIPWLIYALARHLGGRGAALAAAGFSLALPLNLTLGLLALPDALLNMLWLTAVVCYLRALDGPGWRWLVLGLVMALGMLTHYRFVLLPVALALHLLSDRRARVWLGRIGPWMALAITAAAVLMTLATGPDAGSAALKFQLLQRHPWAFNWWGLTFVLRDALIATPLVWLVLLFAAGRLGQVAADRMPAAVLLWAGLLPIATYSLLAPWADQERSQFHWTLCGWLTLCAGLPLLWQWFRQRPGHLSRRGLLVAALLLGLVPGLAVPLYVRWLGAHPHWQPPTVKLLPDNLLGWPQVIERTRAVRAGRPIIADNFMLAAQLSFALGAPVPSLDHPRNHRHGRASQLAQWQLDEQSALIRTPGPSLLVVEQTALDFARQPAWMRSLCDRFADLRLVEEVSVYGGLKRFALFAVDSGHDGCDQPAFWYLDEPLDNSVVGSSVVVRGWAFEDYQGVAAVQVWKDEHLLTIANYGEPRPGVAGFFADSIDPQHPNVGFSATLDATDWESGRHRLQLKVIERDGSERWSRPVTVWRRD